MRFIIINKRSGEAVIKFNPDYKSVTDIPPETIESILESFDCDETLEYVEVYELRNPVTYEKNISYTISQD